CAGAAAPPAPSSTASGVPLLTLSPSLTLSAFTTPACEDGISIEALSLSTVIRLCSAFTVSPGLTKISITATSEKSPMSGTTISKVPPPPVAAGAAAFGASGGGGAFGGSARAGGGAAAAAPWASSFNNELPSPTLSPSLTSSSFTIPSCDDGISIDALSLSTVMSDCSFFTASPGLTSSSMTSTSLKSPMSG